MYGANKLLQHYAAIRAIASGSHVAPVHVQLIISDLCNQSCSFCAYRMEGYPSNLWFGVEGKDGQRNNNPPRFIPTDKALEVVADCAAMGVKAIQFTGGGEPTVHPDHEAIVRSCLEAGMEAAVVSNGIRWKPSLIELLARATWVRVSLDAGNPATYARIRSVSASQFELACQHVNALVELKRRSGSAVVIGTSFIVTHDNWMEIDEAAGLAERLGVDNFRIAAVFQPAGRAYFEKFYEQAESLCRQAAQRSRDGFRVVDMFTQRCDDLQQGSPEYSHCGYQYLTTYIAGDQNVYRCCNTSYNPRGLLGSIKSNSFKELWMSQETQDKLAGFDARGCDRCAFNAQNRLFNILAAPVPAHGNFT